MTINAALRKLPLPDLYPRTSLSPSYHPAPSLSLSLSCHMPSISSAHPPSIPRSLPLSVHPLPANSTFIILLINRVLHLIFKWWPINDIELWGPQHPHTMPPPHTHTQLPLYSQHVLSFLSFHTHTHTFLTLISSVSSPQPLRHHQGELLYPCEWQCVCVKMQQSKNTTWG